MNADRKWGDRDKEKTKVSGEQPVPAPLLSTINPTRTDMRLISILRGKRQAIYCTSTSRFLLILISFLYIRLSVTSSILYKLTRAVHVYANRKVSGWTFINGCLANYGIAQKHAIQILASSRVSR